MTYFKKMMMDRCRKRKWDSFHDEMSDDGNLASSDDEDEDEEMSDDGDLAFNDDLEDINHPKGGSYKFGAFVLDNGLSVLLVSSVELEHGAASLAIGCGSFADPLHIQGLAHLFEHVLFLGSQAYPGLNEFNDFVHQHGGEVAAETKLDHSIFSMHVFSDHFEGALNMFVDMFMNPTMDSGFIKRDLNTIDSEFLLHKYKDSACQEHLFYHTASNTHPFKRFTWGNKEFLSKESLCSEVKKLFYDYYKASNMKLVIISPDELGYLENLVRELFANLQNHTDLKEESRRPPIVSSESCML